MERDDLARKRTFLLQQRSKQQQQKNDERKKYNTQTKITELLGTWQPLPKMVFCSSDSDAVISGGAGPKPNFLFMYSIVFNKSVFMHDLYAFFSFL